MGHMSMVANAYITNHNLDHAEIIVLTTGFSGTLRGWWEKYLTEESRESIKKAIKKDGDGLPIFDERIGQGPPDHLNTFKTTLGLQQPPNKILCRSFPTTLKGAAREWFTKLPTSSIDSSEQLSSAFLRHFVGGQCPKKPADHLLTIRQGEKETIRLYMKPFTRETLKVDDADDKVQLTTFKAGQKSREFVVTLAKNPPKTMAEMLLKAQKYMNAEDALAAIIEEKPGKEGRKKDNRRGQKRERPDHRNSDGDKREDEKTPRMAKFTPLIMPIDKIWTQIKDEHYLKWPRPLNSSPNV
ncbi:uncharacterized protein LOC142623195 [Castanea sativa]|uniref:uncharacterized protein LOC142623195 n=1 Tax=Castanea sativa TaxID=21020 RepID=UPI003F64B71B